ncbi:MAG: hypothetical protein ABFS32_10610 [Bacteroidota bacterium]
MCVTNIIGMELTDSISSSKLKLSSKRLKSGKVQVKFQVNTKEAGYQYGYLLTEPKASLKDVVLKILNSYNQDNSNGHQQHLFDIGNTKQNTEVMIFK